MTLSRYFMYKRISEIEISGDVLSIGKFENFRNKNVKVTEAHYPEVDMQDMPYEDNSFDFVVSDQVIEHIENPFKAVNESLRVLRKGGVAIHTTCLINYYHPSPKDYWRFTPDALKFLCKDFSEIIQCEGWGNRWAVILLLMGDRFRHIKIPKWGLRHKLATVNQERYPIVTWVIARK